MNILFKFCNQFGIKKILTDLELKLPYVSDVNDPFECYPNFECNSNLTRVEVERILVSQAPYQILRSSIRSFDEEFRNGEIHKALIKKAKDIQKEWNKRTCLICVGKEPKSVVMWSHYTEMHKGAVVGIDFDEIFHGAEINPDIDMHKVDYSNRRIDFRINNASLDRTLRLLRTKSKDWRYEREFRSVLVDPLLRSLQANNLAISKNFKGKQTWFIKIKPIAIKKVIFGLYADPKLKSYIERRLRLNPDLRHVKLFQASESDTFKLNLTRIIH